MTHFVIWWQFSSQDWSLTPLLSLSPLSLSALSCLLYTLSFSLSVSLPHSQPVFLFCSPFSRYEFRFNLSLSLLLSFRLSMSLIFSLTLSLNLSLTFSLTLSLTLVFALALPSSRCISRFHFSFARERLTFLLCLLSFPLSCLLDSRFTSEACLFGPFSFPSKTREL